MRIDKEYINKLIYNSGDVFLPISIRNILKKDIIGSSKKTFYISWWSIIHYINGIIVGTLYLKYNYDKKQYLFNMFVIHTLWELWQVLIGMSNPTKITGGGNIVDIFIDTILFMMGAYTIRYYNIY